MPIAALLAAGGCMVGPNYQPPATIMPAAYRELPAGPTTAPAFVIGQDPARAYLELRGTQRELQIAEETLDEQQQTLSVTEDKHRNGLASDLEVLRARTEVESTAAQIPPLQAAGRQYIHVLSTLLGQEPTALSAELEQPAPIPDVSGQVAVGIPSDLLRRRPDIQAAERQLAAATAGVGVATAQLFPQMVLGGVGGLASRNVGDLFNGDSKYYLAGPFVNWTPFIRKGRISNWGNYPEYAEGDMADGLKTLDVRVRWTGQYRRPSPAMAWLSLAYSFWIAYADLDGFRIDAAKHMDPDALRSFCDWIRDFAQSIGKERFLLVGEVPGGRDLAWEVVEKTGMDAVLGIDDIPGKLERMVTGQTDPIEYFNIFRNWVIDEPEGGKHRWYRDQVVTLVDDHDQVRKWTSKWRFCGDSRYRDLAFNVMAAKLTTTGIPCIYYGGEQGFDSGGRPSNSDVVLRENMFGGRFGGLGTQGRHFFNEQGHLYRALASLMELRKQLLTLRRGAQVLHRISGDGVTFGLPRRFGDRMRSLVCWSRMFMDQETLVVLNTDESQSVGAWSTVAPLLRVDGDEFHRIFWHAPKPAAPPAATLTVEPRAGAPTVRLELPPAGFAIYQAAPALNRFGPNPPHDLKPWAERLWHGKIE